MDFFDLIFPKRCAGCRKFRTYLCLDCQHSQPLHRVQICPICERVSADGRTHAACRTKFTIDGATFVFRYKFPITNLIKTLKYKFGREVVNILVDWTSDELKKLYLPSRDFVFVPIPLHPLRRNFRGFNQSEILGKEIAHRIELEFRNDILVRSHFRKPQTEVKEEKKRRANVQGIFSIASNYLLLRGLSNILLFDDVWTTGATMKEAARVLKHNGARFVWGLAIAR